MSDAAVAISDIISSLIHSLHPPNWTVQFVSTYVSPSLTCLSLGNLLHSPAGAALGLGLGHRAFHQLHRLEGAKGANYCWPRSQDRGWLREQRGDYCGVNSWFCHHRSSVGLQWSTTDVYPECK